MKALNCCADAGPQLAAIASALLAGIMFPPV